MIQNCRNCVWAGWGKSPSGRRLFGNFAPCNAPVVLLAPLSAARAQAERDLNSPVGVRTYMTRSIVCAAWEKIPK